MKNLFRVSRIIRLVISGLLVALLLPVLWQTLLVNVGFVYMSHALPGFSERSRFEIMQVGVPRWRDNLLPNANVLLTLQSSEDLLRTAMALKPGDRGVAQGQLITAALSNKVTPELINTAIKYNLKWELGALLLNSEPERAINVWSDFCIEQRSCIDIAKRLNNSAYYAEAVDLLSLSTVRPGISLNDLENYYLLALNIMPNPGQTHADIVRNCVAFFFTGNNQLPPSRVLADIHALCAEGMIVDPYVDNESRLGTALEHAQQALDLGGPTRYRLMIRGWAALAAGQLGEAQTFLRQAQMASGDYYQHGYTDEKMHNLIDNLLKQTGAYGK